MLHMPAFNPAPYGLKDKTADSFAPAFTSVNGRMSVSPTNEHKPAVSGGATTWSPVSRPPENGYRSSSNSASPTISSGDVSPDSPNSKRRRSHSIEHNHVRLSPDDSAAASKHHPAHHSTARDEKLSMEAPQQRNLPPVERPDAERRWATEPRELPHNGYQELQHREPRPTEPAHSALPPVSHVSMGPMSDSNGHDDTSPTELTRAGVQVELKKRKRQFANRTKTGCGTCRRRKKKCDETKPECNNCTRGGFICEGYANKVPWPKNGVSKPPPPLQAKERLSAEVASVYARCQVCAQIHIPHCEPPRQNSYPESHQQPNGAEGGRGRPITVEEHERKPPTQGNWSGPWNEQPQPPRVPYQQEPPPPAQYAPPPPGHERPPSHEHQPVPHQRQDSTHQRPYNPRVYHHTPQSMSQVVTTLPTASTYPMQSSSATSTPSEPVARHQVAQHSRPPPPPSPSMAPPTAAPPAPAPSHYAQQPILHKSEKEKMLAGQPFLPYDRQLADERQHCTGAVYRFNSTSSAAVSIASDERGRSFKTIVAARWIPPRTTERHVGGHLGGNVQVTTPFHCDYGYNLSIADSVVIGSNCQLLDSARICIGRNTKIGARVTISTLKTPTDTKTLKGSNGTEIAQEVWIGENVYIGDGCIIEAGVKIGDGAIVRAGSVVVRDLPRDCIAHGNPAFG